MATEMVLVPKSRYDRLTTTDKELQDKVTYYEELLEKNKSKDTDKDRRSLTDLKKTIDKSQHSDNVVSTEDKVDARTPTKTLSTVSTQASPLTIFTQFDPKFIIYGKRLLVT